jgi:hypothetical protein
VGCHSYDGACYIDAQKKERKKKKKERKKGKQKPMIESCLYILKERWRV